MRIGRGAYRGYHEKAVDAGLRNGWNVRYLHSSANHDGNGACLMKRRQVLEAFRDNGAIRRQTAVGFRRRLMQRPDAQIIDQRHIGGLHVLEHLVRASGKADHRIRTEQGAARLDGDIGLANMHAINLYSLLTSSIYRIQAIIDEQRHSVLRTGLPYDLGCLGRVGDELAS